MIFFNGARPTRLYTILMSQARYNGRYQDNSLRFEAPNLQYFCVRVNDAIVPPELRNRQECYMEWRRVLNRENRKMPFSYPKWLTDYGAIVMDLTENNDSYNEVLPNATNSIVNVELNLTAQLGAAHQILFIGEFRNEKKIGFNSPGRSLYDF